MYNTILPREPTIYHHRITIVIAHILQLFVHYYGSIPIKSTFFLLFKLTPPKIYPCLPGFTRTQNNQIFSELLKRYNGRNKLWNVYLIYFMSDASTVEHNSVFGIHYLEITLINIFLKYLIIFGFPLHRILITNKLKYVWWGI